MAQAAPESVAETHVSPFISPFIIPDEDLRALAAQYGTPLFLIDEETLRSKVRDLRAAFSGYGGPLKLAYSMKANFNPAVLRAFISEGLLFDVTSLEELHFYLRCGGKPENVIYTSVTEEKDEFLQALKSGVKRIVASSYSGATNLVEASATTGLQPKVLLRINPEVGVKAEIRASYRHGKFGVPFSNGGGADGAANLLRFILSSPCVAFEGFHFHLGSQISDPTCFIYALDKVKHFVLKMRKEFPVLSPEVVDIGGGTPVNYGASVPTPFEIGAFITPKLNMVSRELNSKYTLIVESGRYLSAEGCLLISKVVNTKAYSGHKFVFVDAGYHLLLDATLLRQEYPQVVVPQPQPPADEGVKICLAGRLCDTYDIFPVSPASKLYGAEPGKLVVFHNVGAYSIVFNMPFHCQTKPPIVMRRSNGEYTLVRRRESVEELLEEEGGDLPLNL